MAVSNAVLSLSTEPEAFGRVSLEALSLGRPVLGYAHGGVGEQLAAIFPAGAVALRDRGEVVARLTEWYRAPPCVPDRHEFTLERMLSATLEVYREAAAARPKKGARRICTPRARLPRPLRRWRSCCRTAKSISRTAPARWCPACATWRRTAITANAWWCWAIRPLRRSPRRRCCRRKRRHGITAAAPHDISKARHALPPRSRRPWWKCTTAPPTSCGCAGVCRTVRCCSICTTTRRACAASSRWPSAAAFWRRPTARCA